MIEQIENDPQRIKVLLSKLKAMAERGEKHERDVAKLKMKQLLAKYGLRQSKTNSNYRTFKVTDWGDHKNLLLQCIIDTRPYAQMSGNKTYKKIYAELDSYQYIEVLAKWNYYWNELVQQKKALFIAFVVKNDIGIIDNYNNESEIKSYDMESVLNIMGTLKGERFKNSQQKVICNV
jgi:hypothetical protein